MMWKTLPRYRTTNNIAYYKTGNGPAILLIHGVGLRLESWNAQISILSKEHTVYAIDLPGHGESDQLILESPNIDLYTQQIKLFADEIIADAFIVMGHSLGALIAVHFAHKHKDYCLGIVALSCVYQRTKKAMSFVKSRAKKLALEGPKNIIAQTIDRWFGENRMEHNIEVAITCKQWLEDTNIDGYSNAYNAFADEDGAAEKKLIMNNLPIAFITGTLDSNSTPLMSQNMARISPFGMVELIPEAGHMAQMTHSKEVGEVLRSFALGIRN